MQESISAKTMAILSFWSTPPSVSAVRHRRSSRLLVLLAGAFHELKVLLMVGVRSPYVPFH